MSFYEETQFQQIFLIQFDEKEQMILMLYENTTDTHA